METPPPYIILFLVVTILVIAAVLSLLVILILLNQKRQRTYEETLAALKLDHEKNILKTQVEIQEQTFHNIAREIHDNINLSLTLAKLNLNTINWQTEDGPVQKVNDSIAIISDAITDLTDMSRSLNSELIRNQGLLKALQNEMERISRSAKLSIDLQVTGHPVYLSSDRELFIFRIVQEAFNNVLKHAKASQTRLHLHYNGSHVEIRVTDDGVGFNSARLQKNGLQAGLSNIQTRARLFKGDLSIGRGPEKGTELFVTIPFE